MKYLPLIVILTSVSCFAQSPSPDTTKDADTALRLYKQRLSEGGAPMLIIKDGESRIIERDEHGLPAGEFSGALLPSITALQHPDYFPPAPSVAGAEIKALTEQVEALKKLNDALEKELANCKKTP